MSKEIMRAVFCTKYGPPEVLKIELTKRPEPNADEILIKIIATAVNSGDVRVRGLAVEEFLKLVMRLVLGFSKPRKPILGTVLSGIVEEIGKNATRFKPGDEVFAMTGFKFGTYAEYVSIKENGNVVHKPSNASFEESAAIIFGGSTAIHFLNKAKIECTPGKRILIYGSTGAVGTSAIQIAKYYNAVVTAVCSESGIDLVKSLGADDVVVYTKEDFTKTDKKYDIVFDAVGKIDKETASQCLTKGGVFVTVGGLEVASETREQLLFLKDLFETNQLKAVIDKMYNIADIVEAHRYVDTGRKKGNVVVKITE